MLRRSAGEPLLDLVRRIIDTCGVDIELASSVSPAAAARRDNLDLFVKAVAEFQAVDGDGHAAGAAGLPHRRGRLGQRPRPRHADGRRLGQAAHRPPRQGPRVGPRVPRRGLRDAGSPPTGRRTLWTSSPAVLPAPLRGDARDLPAAAPGTTRPPSTPTGRPPARTTARRSSGSGTSRSPAPPTALSVVVVPLEPAGRRRSARRPTKRVVRDLLEEWGEPGRAGGRSPRRATPTRTTPSTLPRPWPEHRAGPRGAPPARRRPSGCVEADADGARRRASTCSTAPRVAEWDDELDRLRRRGAGRARQVVEVPLPLSLSATALARLRDDPDSLRRRAGPADAAAALAGGPVRHPVPCLGRERGSASRTSSTPTSCRAAATPASTTTPTCSDLIASFERGPVRRPRPARRRGAVRAGARRAGGARPDRRGLRASRRRRRWLVVDWKTNRAADRRPAAARALPPGLGRPRRGAARAGARGFYYVRSGDRRRARRPPRPRRARGGARATARLGQSPRAAASAISTISPNVCSRSAAVVSSPVTTWSETVQIASARRPCLAARV